MFRLPFCVYHSLNICSVTQLIKLIVIFVVINFFFFSLYSLSVLWITKISRFVKSPWDSLSIQLWHFLNFECNGTGWTPMPVVGVIIIPFQILCAHIICLFYHVIYRLDTLWIFSLEAVILRSFGHNCDFHFIYSVTKASRKLYFPVIPITP